MTISCLSNNSANIIERTLNGSGTNFDGRQKIVLCRTWMSSIFYRRVETWSPTRQVSYIKIHRIVEKKLLLWFFICKVGSYFLMMKKVSHHVLCDAFIWRSKGSKIETFIIVIIIYYQNFVEQKNKKNIVIHQFLFNQYHYYKNTRYIIWNWTGRDMKVWSKFVI